MPWKSPFITPWAGFRSRNRPTVFAEQGYIYEQLTRQLTQLTQFTHSRQCRNLSKLKYYTDAPNRECRNVREYISPELGGKALTGADGNTFPDIPTFPTPGIQPEDLN